MEGGAVRGRRKRCQSFIAQTMRHWTGSVKAWLKRGLSCLTITCIVSALALLLVLKACDRYCSDTEAQRVQSPDGRYVVTHAFGDNCGGATVAYSHTVRLSRRDAPKDSIVLFETYRSPKGIEIRWTDPLHLEVVANGMDDVRVLRIYSKLQWADVSIQILVDGDGHVR